MYRSDLGSGISGTAQFTLVYFFTRVSLITFTLISTSSLKAEQEKNGHSEDKCDRNRCAYLFCDIPLITVIRTKRRGDRSHQNYGLGENELNGYDEKLTMSRGNSYISNPG